MKNFIILIAFLILGSTTFGKTKHDEKVIYGQDNRVEYINTTLARQTLADATAAMIAPSAINGTSRYNYVCKDEPFYNQRAYAMCTGFLVAPNKIATAGHCIKTQADCNKYRWVFYYHEHHSRIDKQDVYKCKRIIARHMDNQIDYAVIELDRKNTDIAPLTLATDLPLKGDKLFVIGHPSGLPTKIADGATVRSVNNNYFTANLDTYGGNSGSPVFNSRNEVQGILVRGYTDFTYDYQHHCRRSMKCSDTGCSGEDSTNIKYVIEALK